jgi:hypothetical protein
MPYNNYGGMMTQLYRQKENIENMINQYQGMANQTTPIQNIINTSNSSDTEVRYLKPEEDIKNVIITKKTLFIDETNHRICVKELDGTISKNYEIIIPKDAKDIKIDELENKLKELEERLNDKHTEPVVTNVDVKSTTTSPNKSTKSTTVTTF